MKNVTKWSKLSITLATSIAAFTLITYAAVSANQTHNIAEGAAPDSKVTVTETKTLERPDVIVASDSGTAAVETPAIQEQAAPVEAASEKVEKPVAVAEESTTETSQAKQPVSTVAEKSVAQDHASKQQAPVSKETKSSVTVASAAAQPSAAPKASAPEPAGTEPTQASVKVDSPKADVKPAAEKPASAPVATAEQAPAATAAPESKPAKSVKIVSGSQSAKPIVVPKPTAIANSQSSTPSSSSDSAPAEEEYCEEEC